MSNETVLQVTADNGVTWTRRIDGRSTGEQLFEALADLRTMHGDPASRWSWWQEGRRECEHERVWKVLSEWDNGAPAVTAEEAEAFAQVEMEKVDRQIEEERRRRADLATDSYDEARETARLRLLRMESDAAFFARVLAKPASPAQCDDAERRAAESRAAAEALRSEVGDPETVIDRNGYLPAERRELNLSLHIDYWRHPQLRGWAATDRRRFRALLRMPMPAVTEMCSECQAPAEWHDYDLSLRLFHPAPPAGSRDEKIARLMPGWWERCPACTTYKIGHQWGGKNALPDFDGEQWSGMLPPLLRAISISSQPRPRAEREPKPKPLAVIEPGPVDQVMAQLSAAQRAHPDAQVRPGSQGGWELWPS